MPFTVSLTSRPDARVDNDPWTQARMEEAATRTGPWTQVELFTLTPVDTDPAAPQSRDFTSDLVTAYPGWVRIVFLDASGDQQPTEPLFVGSTIRPSVQEIADLMPDRLTLPGGGEDTTFSANTRPTATQVDALIDRVLDSVEAKIPPDSAGHLQRAGRSIVALHTAILTEATYFSHQGDVNTSRIELWERLITQHAQSVTGGAPSTRIAIA